MSISHQTPDPSFGSRQIRRINLFGGPGVSKSTTAARIFAGMKTNGDNVELVTEYVKNWAFIDRVPEKWDQVYLFGKQLNREYVPLTGGANLIISDSPLLLSCFYANQLDNNDEITRNLIDLALAFEAQYPSINIILRRGDRPYNPIGRFQTLDEALKIDNNIKTFIRDYTEYLEIDYNITDTDLINLVYSNK
jgi:hypothetical protein